MSSPPGAAARAALADAGPTDRLPPYRFGMRCRVEVSDTDLGGIVYYGRYPILVDRAVVALRRHLGIAPLGPPGHLLVVRAFRAEYLASAAFDDELEVLVRTAAVGRTSHTVEARIERLDPDGPAPILEAWLTIVGLAGYGARPSRVPDDMRAAIESFEGLEGGSR